MCFDSHQFAKPALEGAPWRRPGRTLRGQWISRLCWVCWGFPATGGLSWTVDVGVRGGGRRSRTSETVSRPLPIKAGQRLTSQPSLHGGRIEESIEPQNQTAELIWVKIVGDPDAHLVTCPSKKTNGPCQLDDSLPFYTVAPCGLPCRETARCDL